jgi:two-component system response regulator RegA
MIFFRTKRILVVDDDEVFRERLATSLRRRGHEVATAADLTETMRISPGFRPECAVIDLRLEGESGLVVARNLRAILPDVRVLVLTGYGSIATAVDAMRLGAVDYLSKPADADQIEAALFGGGSESDATTEPGTPVPSLERVEWEHMQRVLRDCGGNISATARKLGIERRTLQRKLQKYPPES